MSSTGASSVLSRCFPLAAIPVLFAGLAPRADAAHLSVIREGPESAGAREANDRFGTVLCAGDFNGDGFEDLATGVPYEDHVGFPGSDHGSFIVNWGSAVGLTHVGASYHLPTIVENGLLFGFALASADFEKDGYDDLVVGMPYANGTGTSDSGAIAVYRGSASGLLNSPTFYVANQLAGFSETGDLFGFSLAAGDVTGDGSADLVIGSPGEDSSAGAAFFVFGTPNGLTTAGAFGVKQSSYGGTSLPGDRFGAAVAIGNFTGFTPLPPLVNPQDVVVGAPGKDYNGTPNVGQVTLFGSTNSGPQVGLASTHSPVTLHLPGSTNPNREFGTSFAVGDFYHDGYDDLAIGRPGSSSYAGTIEVLKGSATGFSFGNTRDSQDFVLGAEPGNRFGEALASGDFDADGFDDVLVGAPGHTQSFLSDKGRVFLYKSMPVIGLGSWDDFQHADLNVDDAAFDEVGLSVAFGYFDDTGRANMVAGAPGSEGNEGRVHVIAPWRQPGLLQCRNSIVMDCDDRIVFSQKPFDPVYIASTAKNMTILIASERSQLPSSDPNYVPLTATYFVPDWVDHDIGGSQFGLVPGEIVTLRALMDMTMSVSGNDAAFAIADLLTGEDATFQGYFDTVPEFVAEMNVRAAQLGMNDTTFTNPAGVSGPTPESTAYDMMLLGRAAMQNALFESVVNNPSWDIPRSVPAAGGSYWNFVHSVGGGFVAALKGMLPQATGAKDGGTPAAGITGVFTAREDFFPWGTAAGSSFNTPSQAGWVVPDAADMLELALGRCINGPVVAGPVGDSDWDEMPFLIPALANETLLSFYPPDPIHPEGLLEIYNQVQDGQPTELHMEVERISIATIPDLETAQYQTDGVTGHGGITFMNQGAQGTSVAIDTNTVGSPFFAVFLLPGESFEVPAAQLPAGTTSLQMNAFVSSLQLANLRITETFAEDYVLGSGLTNPTSSSMVFHRLTPSLVTPKHIDARLIGQDTDPGHFVAVVLRGPDETYTFDPCSASEGLYGAGWPGDYGAPTLSVDSPPVLGSAVTLQFGNSTFEDAPGLVIAGLAPVDVATAFGGNLLVVPQAVYPVTLPAEGLQHVSPIGSDATLCGLSIYYQLVVVDSAASHGFAFSRGLKLVLGN